MSITQAIVDRLGDFFHTSKLARMNDAVFGPALGTRIARSEWDQCKDKVAPVPAPYLWEVLSTRFHFQNSFDPATKNGKYNRQDVAKGILERMQDGGTKFSRERIYEFIGNLQTEPGVNPISYVTSKQLDDDSRLQLLKQLRFQRLHP